MLRDAVAAAAPHASGKSLESASQRAGGQAETSRPAKPGCGVISALSLLEAWSTG